MPPEPLRIGATLAAPMRPIVEAARPSSACHARKPATLSAVAGSALTPREAHQVAEDSKIALVGRACGGRLVLAGEVGGAVDVQAAPREAEGGLRARMPVMGKPRADVQRSEKSHKQDLGRIGIARRG